MSEEIPTIEPYRELWKREEQDNKELRKEIERLNNIITELEKELNKDYDTYVCKNKQYGKTYQAGAIAYREHILYKLKELKENTNGKI